MWHVAPRVGSTGATREGDQRGIRIDSWVALQPPPDPQPQVRERPTRQERLLAEKPRCGQRREEPPLVSDRELGRAVVAQHAGQEVAVLEPDVGAPEKGREPTLVGAVVGISRGGGTEIVEAVRVGEEADAHGLHPVGLELAVFIPAHDVEAGAFAHLALVGEQRLQRLSGVVEVLLLREPVPQRHADRAGVRVVLLSVTARVVQPDVDPRRQAGRHVQIGAGVGQGAGRVADVDELIRHRHRVVHRADGVVVVRPERIGERDRLGRVVDRDVLEHAAREATLVLVGEVAVVDAGGRDIDADPQPVVQIRVRGAEPALNPLETGGQGHALLLRVIHRGAIARGFAPAGERQVVIVRHGRAGDGAIPIGIRDDAGSIARVGTGLYK